VISTFRSVPNSISLLKNGNIILSNHFSCISKLLHLIPLLPTLVEDKNCLERLESTSIDEDAQVPKNGLRVDQ
jgi:hypothetical protein